MKKIYPYQQATKQKNTSIQLQQYAKTEQTQTKTENSE